MLEGSFYKILANSSSEASHAEFRIQFEADHEIFRGHFPGNPVVPGVCMIQIIQELLSLKVEKAVILRSASVIKFLHIIDPGKDPQVNVKIDYVREAENIKTSANFANEQTTFLKFKGEFI